MSGFRPRQVPAAGRIWSQRVRQKYWKVGSREWPILFRLGARHLPHLSVGAESPTNLLQAPPELLPRLERLLKSKEYSKPDDGDVEEVQKTEARILMVAETRTPVLIALERYSTVVKVVIPAPGLLSMHSD